MPAAGRRARQLTVGLPPRSCWPGSPPSRPSSWSASRLSFCIAGLPPGGTARRQPNGHGPRAQEPGNGSHSCAATGPGPQPGRAHLPHTGQPRPGQQWQSNPQGPVKTPAPEPRRRHPPDQPGMLMQPWNPALIKRRSPLHEPATGLVDILHAGVAAVVRRSAARAGRQPADGAASRSWRHLGVLPPILPARQPEQRHGTGYDQEDQLQAHKPKIIARPDGPRPARPALDARPRSAGHLPK